MGDYLTSLHVEHKERQLRLKKAALKAVCIPEPAPESVPLVEAMPEIPKKKLFVNTFEIILHEVCTYYNVRKLDILSQRRIKNIAEARHMLIYMLYRMTSFTNPQIAERINKDPSTVGYGIEAIEKNLERHKSDIDQLEALIAELLLQRKTIIAI